VGKTRQPFLAVCEPKFTKFRERVGESPYRLTSFFPIVGIMFHCRDVRSNFEVCPKKCFLPPACGW